MRSESLELNTIEDATDIERDARPSRNAIANRVLDQLRDWFAKTEKATQHQHGAAEATRREDLLANVQQDYRVVGGKYYLKDSRASVLAFKDNGNKLVTHHNDNQIAFSMVALAEAKGWQAIKVTGHPDFRREVWLEAGLRGISVRGFEPKEQDLKDLETRLARTMRNAVERDEAAERSRQEATPEAARTHSDTARAHQEVQAQQEPPSRPGVESSKAQTVSERLPAPPQTETRPAEGERVEPVAAEASKKQPSRRGAQRYTGTLLDHGPAPYKRDPDEKMSYFVTLRLASGKKATLWGLDLARGMAEVNPKLGDSVTLEFQGRRAVMVEANVRDDHGKVVGKELIETHRNQWEVTKNARQSVVEAVAMEVIAGAAKTPEQARVMVATLDRRLEERAAENRIPTILIYDKNAPAAPVVETSARAQVEHSARTR